MLLYPSFRLLAKWFNLLKVVYWLKKMPWIPLFWVLAMLVVQSSCFAICFPPAFSTPTTCLWALVIVGSGVQDRSAIWGSIVSLLGVSSGGGAPGTLSKGRWISWLSSSMAIQVYWLKSNHNGFGRSQPAGRKIPLANSPSFIDIGWYFW